jgi:hypothetical protein
MGMPAEATATPATAQQHTVMKNSLALKRRMKVTIADLPRLATGKRPRRGHPHAYAQWRAASKRDPS